MEPEGELGDFDGLGVDIDAVDVVGEDGADDGVLIEEAGLAGNVFEAGAEGLKILLDGFFADDLVAQQVVERRREAVGEQHVWLEEPPEDEAAKGGGRGVAKQGGFGGGGGAADDEALELAAPEAADVEPELVHVGDEGEERHGEVVAVASLPGGLEVIEALFDGRAVVVFARLAGVEAGADVLEFAEHLRDAVATGAEAPEREVGEAGAAGLACAGDFVLRAAGVGGVFLALELVAPSFAEEALDEGGFGRAFVELLAPGPCAKAGEQGGGFGAVLEGGEFGLPVGAEEMIFEEGLGGPAAAG